MAGELVSRTLEIFHSGAWEDITLDGLNRDAWRIRRGVSNRGGSAGEGSLRLPLRNGVSKVNPLVSSRYARGNALSDLFGLLPPNTPIRVSAGLSNATPHVAATNGDNSDTTAHVAPSVVSPTAEALLLCTWAAPEPAGTWTLPGSMTASASSSDARTEMDSASEAISAAGATGTRTATFSASEDYVAASVLLHGDTLSVADAVGFTTSGTIAAATAGNWLVVAAYFSWDTKPDPQRPGAPQDDDGGGWIPLATSDVFEFADVTGETAQLRVWAKRVRTSGSVTVTLDDPSGDLGSIVAIVWEVAGAAEWSPRMVAETVALPPRADVSQNDLWTPVEAAGVLRRLGIPSSPLRPALERATVAVATEAATPPATVAAYWPLAGLGQDVRLAPSPVPGVVPAVVRPTTGALELAFDVEWSADRTGPGLGACPTTRGKNSGVGLTGQIPSGVSNRFGWLMWGRGDGDDDMATQFTKWVDTDSTSWLLWVIWSGTQGNIQVIIQALDEQGGSVVADLTNTDTITRDDVWHNFAAIVEQSGADAGLTVFMDGEEIEMTLNSGSLSGLDIGSPAQSRVTGTITQGGRGMSIGHPTVLRGSSVADLTALVQDLHRAGRGFEGEPAGRRVERLCFEQGVPFSATGDLDASAPLGPQHPENFLDVLGEAAKVEAGGSRAPVLVEQRTDNGLHFNTLAGMSLPRTPGLILDYDAAHLSPPFDPTPDDFGLVNDATAKRRDGGEARVEVEGGPRGITAAGRYDAAETFGALSDTHLDGIARYWTVHGTWDEDRYPVIRINMRGLSTRTDGAALVAAVQALDPGALVRITNPPAWLPQQDIDQIVLGITETISTEQWLVDLHTTAARPFTVAVLEDDTVGLAQSDSATLDEPLDTTETAVDIDCGAGPDWVHDGVDFDLLIRPAGAPSLSGEMVTVTAVGAMSGTFPNRKVTLTVTRSVNGIVRSHAAGAKVEWATKAYIGLWG